MFVYYIDTTLVDPEGASRANGPPQRPTCVKVCGYNSCDYDLSTNDQHSNLILLFFRRSGARLCVLCSRLFVLNVAILCQTSFRVNRVHRRRNISKSRGQHRRRNDSGQHEMVLRNASLEGQNLVERGDGEETISASSMQEAGLVKSADSSIISGPS